MFFETVSQPLRINIIEVLRQKPMNVTKICKTLGEEQSKISHNLRKLCDCHLVEFKKQGRERIYSLNEETMIPLMQLVEKHVIKYCGKECIKKNGQKNIPGQWGNNQS